jgi:hypothetical protein
LDFVMRRFSSPGNPASLWGLPTIHSYELQDSCSRPPDDPSDDAPDDFPGASPHGGSDDSDTIEQPPDSPPLHSDHDPKTLITVPDNLSASTSSTSALFVPYSNSSNEISGASTTPEPVSYRPFDRASLRLTRSCRMVIPSKSSFCACGVVVTGYLAMT